MIQNFKLITKNKIKINSIRPKTQSNKPKSLSSNEINTSNTSLSKQNSNPNQKIIIVKIKTKDTIHFVVLGMMVEGEPWR